MDQKKAGVLLSYGQTVLSTLISLVYTPVMLRLLGQSEYGLYTLVNGFISNLSLMSFGLRPFRSRAKRTTLTAAAKIARTAQKPKPGANQASARIPDATAIK